MKMSGRRADLRVGGPKQHPSTEPFRGSFIGRERDLAAVAKLVEDGARLVTLLGPGGIGKTRLLHRLVGALEGEFSGAVVTELASARSGEDVVGGVASVLGGAALGATSASEAAQRIGRALARRGDFLLALDNLEQLDDGALPLLPRWLAAAPRLVVLTTSRVRLGLTGEVVHHVAPLSLTNDGGSCEAMRLFCERARAVRGDLVGAELQDALRIVTLLDGIPLAIEMAATRLAVLSPSELLARLSRPLTLLTAGRNEPDRHASLSRVLGGSWELLGDDERTALADIGVFAGGFTLEAAEAVLTVKDALGALERLVDSSLLRKIDDKNGRSRLAPYEVVREYALDRLAGRTRESRARHAAFFARWGSERGVRIEVGEGAAAALAELSIDEANLAAAAAFTREMCLCSVHVSLLLALGPVRMLRGQLDAWTHELSAALGRLPGDDARARLALARALHEIGRPDETLDAYDAAIAAARAEKNASLLALGLTCLGRHRSNLGEFERAFALFEEARAIEGASPDVRAFAEACHEFYAAEVGTVGDVRATAAYVERCRRHADPRELVFWLVQLGRAESELTRAYERPRRLLEEALVLARDAGDLRGEGFALFALGSHCMTHEQHHEAVAMLREAASVLREAGRPRYEAWALGFLGATYALERSWDEAARALDDAIVTLRACGDAPREAHLLAYRGVVAAETGDVEKARACFARSSAIAPAESRYHAAVLDLCAGQLDVFAGREAAARGEDEAAKESLSRARDRLVAIGWPAPHDEARVWPWGHEFYETRLAAALLANAIARVGHGALRVARDGSSFVLPSGRDVIVPGRGKLQRLLAALAAARAIGAAPVDGAALIEAAWAGERMRREAANNRLHVALDSLRRIGLREVLLRGDGGWRLDPSIPFSWRERT